MKIGLVGFPGSGKTTVFNALTGLSADTGGAKGGPGVKANIGVVKVPDPRVEALSKLYAPKKTTFAEASFSDLPGGGSARSLDRGALDAMRGVDALCHVVRAFELDGEAAEPLRELTDLEAETVLADLDLVEKRLARLAKERTASPAEVDLLKRLHAKLEANEPLRGMTLTPDERNALSGYRLLTLLPLLLVLNVDEGSVSAPAPADVVEAAKARGLGLVVLSARVEMDIARMPPEDQAEFCKELGLEEPARDRFIRAAFALLDLISMLTAGPDECRAWPVVRGIKAQRAAGKIHSDIERGFIRVEVIDWRDLVSLGSEARCREAGKLRIEGRDYVIRDGDVVNFRFNV